MTSPDYSRLEQILNANKATKNTTNIYSEEEFFQISRLNIKEELLTGRDSQHTSKISK